MVSGRPSANQWRLRRVALRDRDEAREPRLGREQVVEASRRAVPARRVGADGSRPRRVPALRRRASRKSVSRISVRTRSPSTRKRRERRIERGARDRGAAPRAPRRAPCTPRPGCRCRRSTRSAASQRRRRRRVVPVEQVTFPALQALDAVEHLLEPRRRASRASMKPRSWAATFASNASADVGRARCGERRSRPALPGSCRAAASGRRRSRTSRSSSRCGARPRARSARSLAERRDLRGDRAAEPEVGDEGRREPEECQAAPRHGSARGGRGHHERDRECPGERLAAMSRDEDRTPRSRIEARARAPSCAAAVSHSSKPSLRDEEPHQGDDHGVQRLAGVKREQA
mgnify:CR=1 FL=1